MISDIRTGILKVDKINILNAKKYGTGPILGISAGDALTTQTALKIKKCVLQPAKEQQKLDLSSLRSKNFCQSIQVFKKIKISNKKKKRSNILMYFFGISIFII